MTRSVDLAEQTAAVPIVWQTDYQLTPEEIRDSEDVWL